MPAALGFGYASFYNHSPEANAFYSFSGKRNTLNIYAYTTIEPGTEITINYNGHPRNKEAVYFPEQNTAWKNILYLQEVKGKGRAVFCSEDIAAGDTIEVCPVIVVPADDFVLLNSTPLSGYCFYFNKEENTLALAMGFGSMYNHRLHPNAVYILDREEKEMIFTAHESIPAHTEICINYGGAAGEDYSKWFKDRGISII